VQSIEEIEDVVDCSLEGVWWVVSEAELLFDERKTGTRR